MADQKYEIEIKSLLGTKENAQKLQHAMANDPSFLEIGSHKQLNHYFEGGNLNDLQANISNLLTKDANDSLLEIVKSNPQTFSVRTRWADGKVLLVIKVTVDDTSSSNGTARLEWEQTLNKTLEEIDALILQSGFHYQAKWSRERTEYKYKGANVSIDKNAGYGYLSEFEMVIDDEQKASETKELLRKMMSDVGIEELPQDRLARMFDFYNKNWAQYYGTDNIFTIQ